MNTNRENKELTHEKFAKFLVWLNPDEEKAGDEYERLRFRLTTFFAHRNCRFPEELADETINRVIIKIETEEVENKTAFCFGVAKFVFLESTRKEKDHDNIDEIQVAAKKEEKQENKDNSNSCLNKCLSKLDLESRKLIMEYFSESNQAKIDLHSMMAEQLKISKTALRMKVMRIKKKLRNCINECLTA